MHRMKILTISSTDPADDLLVMELNAAFSSRVSPKETSELVYKKLKKVMSLVSQCGEVSRECCNNLPFPSQIQPRNSY